MTHDDVDRLAASALDTRHTVRWFETDRDMFAAGHTLTITYNGDSLDYTVTRVEPQARGAFRVHVEPVVRLSDPSEP